MPGRSYIAQVGSFRLVIYATKKRRVELFSIVCSACRDSAKQIFIKASKFQTKSLPDKQLCCGQRLRVKLSQDNKT